MSLNVCMVMLATSDFLKLNSELKLNLHTFQVPIPNYQSLIYQNNGKQITMKSRMVDMLREYGYAQIDDC